MLNDFRQFFNVMDEFQTRTRQEQAKNQQAQPITSNKPQKAKKAPKKGN